MRIIIARSGAPGNRTPLTTSLLLFICNANCSIKKVMSSFDNRKKSFEGKFAHDEEALFKIKAKRNRLLGEWVADKLNKIDKDKEDYILEVIKSDMLEPGDDDVFRKVKKDLSEGNFDNIDEEIRNKMNEFMETAKKAFL
jgi:hypothetical protein